MCTQAQQCESECESKCESKSECELKANNVSPRSYVPEGSYTPDDEQGIGFWHSKFKLMDDNAVAHVQLDSM